MDLKMQNNSTKSRFSLAPISCWEKDYNTKKNLKVKQSAQMHRQLSTLTFED